MITALVCGLRACEFYFKGGSECGWDLPSHLN